MTTIEIPASARHIKFTPSDKAKERRLREVTAHIDGINSHVLSKIVELADHKGDLTVYLSVLATQEEFEILKSAWENPPGDCGGSIRLLFAGREITHESFAAKEKFEFEQVGEEVLARVEVTPGNGFDEPRLTRLFLRFKTPISLYFSKGKCDFDGLRTGTSVCTQEIFLSIFDRETPLSIYDLLTKLLTLTSYTGSDHQQNDLQPGKSAKLQLDGDRYQIRSMALSGDSLMGLSWLDQTGGTKQRNVRSLAIRPSDTTATYEFPGILRDLLENIEEQFIALCVASARAA